MTDTARLLNVTRLTKTFRGLHPLEDVDLYVAPGEILGVIGPNGAAKRRSLTA